MDVQHHRLGTVEMVIGIIFKIFFVTIYLHM